MCGPRLVFECNIMIFMAQKTTRRSLAVFTRESELRQFIYFLDFLHSTYITSTFIVTIIQVIPWHAVGNNGKSNT